MTATRYVQVKNTGLVYDKRGLLTNYIKETQEGLGFDAIKKKQSRPLNTTAWAGSLKAKPAPPMRAK
jgi:hypothetical protein